MALSLSLPLLWQKIFSKAVYDVFGIYAITLLAVTRACPPNVRSPSFVVAFSQIFTDPKLRGDEASGAHTHNALIKVKRVYKGRRRLAQQRTLNSCASKRRLKMY